MADVGANAPGVDFNRPSAYTPASIAPLSGRAFACKETKTAMKVRSSLKTLKTRHRDCKLVRRKGVMYVINKTNPRFKAKQG